MTICKHSVKAAFGNAVATYDDSAVVQREILNRLLAKLKLMSVDVKSLLDLGSGTGMAQSELCLRFGSNSYFPLDIALPMLEFANKNISECVRTSVCADAEALPYKAEVFDVIFSASTLQWCNEITGVFTDCLRILRPKGLLIFSLFGPDTLHELRHSFAHVDSKPRVKSFTDMHELGDQLLQAGFSSPVMEAEKLTVEYSDPMQLLRDLKSTGATNKLADRPRGLLTKRQIEAVLNEYQQFRLPNGAYPATYEVVYGHAWKADLTKPQNKNEGEWQPIRFS